MKLTADTITDDQIRALFYADEIAAIELTVATLPGWSAVDRLEARTQCAEIYNARMATSPLAAWVESFFGLKIEARS